MQIAIFDIDGVLVQAHGYLRALQETVAHFSRSLGVGDWPPSEPEVRHFEAQGISSEWDISAACVALLLEERWAEEPDLQLPGQWERAVEHLRAHPLAMARPDYVALAGQIGLEMQDQVPPAVAARRVIEARARRWLGDGEGWPTLSRLLDPLLNDVYDVLRSPVTRHFQHLTLGSERFEATYGLSQESSVRSYLEAHDRPLLSPPMRDRMLQAREAGWAMALCTLRPSMAPWEGDERVRGYSPEAELARSMVGLDGMPVIGQGHMLWLARRHGEKVQDLVKPFPAQALAALGVSLGAPEPQALQAAYDLYRNKTLRPPLDGLRRGAVHVFEDTPGGLAATQAALDVLRASGANLSWHPHGIAAPGSEKEAALQANGATKHASVNDAIRAVLNGPGEV